MYVTLNISPKADRLAASLLRSSPTTLPPHYSPELNRTIIAVVHNCPSSSSSSNILLCSTVYQWLILSDQC